MDFDMNELLEMEDYELITAVRDLIIEEIRNLPSEDELANFPEIKFYLISAGIFDLEMQNGGMCQFVANQGHYHGPDLIASLDAIGAVDHGKLVADFFENCGMDSAFFDKLLYKKRDPYSVLELYSELLQKYPFDKFDNAYFQMDRNCPLEGILGTYIRNNLSVFI